MTNTLKTSELIRLNNEFLDIESPKDLAKLLDIKYSELIKYTKGQHYKSFITKGKGRKRIIFEPSPRLKLIQRKLNYYLQALYISERPKSVHGFVKSVPEEKLEYSILSNAYQHVGKNYVINADIFRFFPSINANMVRNVFLQEPFEFEFDENTASAIALLCLNKNWLPTGAPTSPIISNFVCIKMDKELEEFASKYEYTYTRYADDLTFSGANKPDGKFKEELSSILEKHSFKLNYRKYRVLSKFTRQTVTGIVVNEKLAVNRKYKKRLRAIQHDIRVNGIEKASERHNGRPPEFFELDEFQNSVLGKELFLKQVDEYNKKKKEEAIIEKMKGTPQYMLFIDLELNGFIIDVFDDEKQASDKMDELWQFIESLRTYSYKETVEKVRLISQNNYKLTEKNRYESVSLMSRSNGIYTAGIVKVDKLFTIEIYLNRRTQ